MIALAVSLLVAAAPAQAKPSAPAEVPLPKIQSVTLDNGLKVLAFERHEQPVFVARLAIPAGEIYEPAGKTGIASLTAGVLTKGTTTRDAETIISWLDTHGAELSAGTDEDFTLVSAQGLSRDFDGVLSLLADAVLRPSFPKAEVERLRPQHEADVRQRYDDPGTLAELHTEYLLYGNNHPFGRPETPATVAALDAASAADFYKAFYRPNGAVLVLAGDFDAAKVLQKVTAAFASWARKEAPATPLPQPLSRPRIRVVNQPDATQTQIRFAHPLPGRHNPDEVPLRVVNAVLGGGFGSRLMSALRIEGGKTYSVHTSVDESATAGEFILSTFTRNAEVGSTLQKSMQILRTLAGAGPNEEELSRAKGLVGGGFVVANSEMRAIAASLLEQEAYGLGPDWVRTFRGKVQAVTPELANEAAHRYLAPERFVVVLVGKADEILPQVKAAFPGVELEVREASEPVADEDRPKKAAAVPPEVAQAREIFAAALQAVGGEAAVRQALSGTLAQGKLSGGPEGQEQTVPITGRWAGSRQRLELRAPDMTRSMVITPEAAFVVTGDGKSQALPDAIASEQRRAMWLGFPHLFELPERADLQLAYLRDDEREENGVTATLHVVEVRQPQPGAEARVLARLHFDARTHLPYGYLRMTVDGQQERLRLLDYRQQGALLYPMRQIVRVNGQKAGDLSFDRVVFQAIPDATFAPPK